MFNKSESIQIVVEGGDSFFKGFSLSDLGNEELHLGAFFEWRSGQSGPMVEHTLWESLTLGQSSQMGGESEGFSDWQEAFNQVHGGSLDLFFLVDDTSSGIEAIVHSSHSVHGGGNFGQEDGFL